MPANTPNGWPYVLPADNVADYPVTALAQANKLDSVVPFAMAAGAGVIAMSGVQNSAGIYFPAGRFTQPPIVVVTKATGNGANKLTIFVAGGATTLQATATGGMADGSSYTGNIAFNWIAIQMTAAGSPGQEDVPALTPADAAADG